MRDVSPLRGAAKALFAFPVIARIREAPEVAEAARRAVGEGAELGRVGVFTYFGRRLRADREIAHLRRAGVDDLVRGFRTAGGAGDDVAGADRVALGAIAQLAAAFEDDEHLLFGAVTVERAGALARRHHGEVAAQLARADTAGDLTPAQVVAFGGGALWQAGGDRRVGGGLHHHVGKVEDRSGHARGSVVNR